MRLKLFKPIFKLYCYVKGNVFSCFVYIVFFKDSVLQYKRSTHIKVLNMYIKNILVEPLCVFVVKTRMSRGKLSVPDTFLFDQCIYTSDESSSADLNIWISRVKIITLSM